MKPSSAIDFRVANTCFEIRADYYLEDQIFRPHYCGLLTDFSIQQNNDPDKCVPRINWKINLRSASETSLRLNNNELTISTNSSNIGHVDYNPQFSIFGNKGILSRFMLHALEKEQVFALHGCAVIHPNDNHVVIAVGPSGSGKSAFVMAALMNGWKLLASELVLVSNEMLLYRGNSFDLVSEVGLSFALDHLTSCRIYEHEQLKEPIGIKYLMDLAAYQASTQSYNLTGINYTIAVLALRNTQVRKPTKLLDKDFILRALQYSASEILCSPLILGCELFPPIFTGNTQARNVLIENLIANAAQILCLGGDFSDMVDWLNNT